MLCPSNENAFHESITSPDAGGVADAGRENSMIEPKFWVTRSRSAMSAPGAIGVPLIILALTVYASTSVSKVIEKVVGSAVKVEPGAGEASTTEACAPALSGNARNNTQSAARSEVTFLIRRTVLVSTDSSTCFGDAFGPRG